MNLTVADIIDLPGLPTTKAGAIKWLKTKGVPLLASSKGFAFAISDLPHDVARAVVERMQVAEGLELGERDEAAHASFNEAPPKMRAKAELKARIARFMIARERIGWTRAAIFKAVRNEFGASGNSENSLFRLLAAVEGVDIANFAPALLDDYNVEGRPRGPSWDDAWYFALALINDAGAEWPLDAAYDRLEEIKADMGWNLPSRSAFHKRWESLSEVDKFTLRHGAEAARKRFRQPAMRNRETLAPNDVWSMDGRHLDTWAQQSSGAPFRPVELRLVDVATGFIIATRICQSENSVDTVAMIVEAVRIYGIPKEIYTDNGRAFHAFIVSGMATFKFRKRKKRKEGEWEPPGVCHQLGIHVRFAKPANGQAKLAERSFAETSKRIDAAPEFVGGHAGSRIDRKPDAPPAPVSLDLLTVVHDREIAYHNARKRRSGIAKGRSFEEMYRDGMAGQVKQVATERQLYLAALLYKPASVDRNGRVKVEGWTYGQPDTMLALLKFFDLKRDRAKEKILVGVAAQRYCG